MNQNLIIKQGESVSIPFYCYSGTPVTRLISAITLTFPPVFTTSVDHGLPTEEIPATLSTIRGPRALNTDPYRTVYALKTGLTTFSVATLNASGLAAYTGGGYLRYVPPLDVTSYTARMQIRRSINDSTTIASWTSAAGELAVGTTNGRLVLTLTAAVTAALGFTSGVYNLEIVSPTAIVTRAFSGKIVLDREVTR